MKFTPTIIHHEKSHDNTSTVPAYAGKNKTLIRYLESKKFQSDYEKAMAEKAAK
jgi:hypothetical protein